jgi:hypothetical protein
VEVEGGDGDDPAPCRPRLMCVCVLVFSQKNFFETGCCYVVEADLELIMVWP